MSVSYQTYSYHNAETKPVYLVSNVRLVMSSEVETSLDLLVLQTIRDSLIEARDSSTSLGMTDVVDRAMLSRYHTNNGRLFRNTAVQKAGDQTRTGGHHNQRAGKLSSIGRYDSRGRNFFRPPEGGFEFCPRFQQEAQRIGQKIVGLARENCGHWNSLGFLAKKIVRRAYRCDRRCGSRCRAAARIRRCKSVRN